jgi:hypothetical protein
MRYSVPLFVYGDGLTRDSAKADLSWRQVSRDGIHLGREFTAHRAVQRPAVAAVSQHIAKQAVAERIRPG